MARSRSVAREAYRWWEETMRRRMICAESAFLLVQTAQPSTHLHSFTLSLFHSSLFTLQRQHQNPSIGVKFTPSRRLRGR